MTLRLALALVIAAFSSVILGPLNVEAQRAATLPRIGILGVPPQGDPAYRTLLQGLQELGYTEGKGIQVEFRLADPRRLPDLATELVRLKVDVIVTFGTPAAQAAKQATSTVPIVMAVIGDPVRTGIVASLARPGGNITGITNLGPGSATKRLELVKEAIPNVARVALLWNSANRDQHLHFSEVEAGARSLGLTFQSVPVRSGEELEPAFAAMLRDRPSAVIVTGDTVLQSLIGRILAIAATNRLPVVGQLRENAEAGALMTYGASRPEQIRSAAAYIDKILKGAKPADLPIQQPTKFDLVINLRTARTLGFAVPPSLLLRADHVIE